MDQKEAYISSPTHLLLDQIEQFASAKNFLEFLSAAVRSGNADFPNLTESDLITVAGLKGLTIVRHARLAAWTAYTITFMGGVVDTGEYSGPDILRLINALTTFYERSYVFQNEIV
jgi:hypothetical protein